MAKNKLLDKIRGNSTITDTAILSQSIFFEKKDMIPTSIPALNIALSGTIEGGLTPGFTMFAGPSKHFKTLFTLVLMKAYLDKYADAVALFYDAEFGTPITYFDSLGIDRERVVHTPITDVEQLKFDIMQQLEGIERGDHVFIAIDSIGNLASKKEVADALDGKSVADMSRAKQLKSMFRMITPHLTIKDIPLVAVNHTYETLEMFSKTVVGGGTGSYYSADNIFIIGRRQSKTGTGAAAELEGYEFIINVEKSRYVREKSKIPITVKFEGGISPWTGLLDIALEAGLVTSPSKGKYSRVDPLTGEIEDKKWTAKTSDCSDFWSEIITSKAFQIWVRNNFQVSSGNLMSDEEIDMEVADVEEDE